MDADAPTQTLPAPDPPSSGASSTSRSLDGGRFAPGALIDARYRIIGLLGRGGMGEVYRAEDLRLGEQVALKFLPARLAQDGAALARFHREVRTARQITHRSVVRVHDIGEVGGEPFLSMEYVPGEDLSSLLKRIGRLPQEKGLSLARQICAGLAAAHDRGVLHRDLKPANVMIDGDGNARINDFGLARLASDLEPGELAGTPAYMAPELFEATPASVASDVYALGLILHEIFTGEPAVRGGSFDELREAHRTEASSLSTIVPGLDPAIDRTVRHCLEKNPAARPPGALDVAAGLPGGDPLAAALAAGETPSPAMVARAEVHDRLPRPLAIALLAVGFVGLGLIFWRAGALSVFVLDGTPLKPAVLEHRAAEILELARPGLEERVGGFRLAPEYWSRALEAAEIHLGTPPVQYWIRAGERPVEPVGRWSTAPFWDDPPSGTPGTARVVLDSRGRLLELVVGPDEVPAGRATPIDWTTWFEASGLDPKLFSATEADFLPATWADGRFAWEGSSDRGAARIEATSLGQRPLSWRLAFPETTTGTNAQPPLEVPVALTLFAVMIGLGGFVAVRNIRAGRGDIRGALALACLVGGSVILRQLSPFSLTNFSGFFLALSTALMYAFALLTVYLAIEPSLRRQRPRTLVSWNRALRGRLSDPLVARDLLLGLATTLGGLGLWEAGSPELARAFYPHGLAALEGLVPSLMSLVHPMVLLVPTGILFLYALPGLFLSHTRLTDALGSVAVFLLAVALLGRTPAALIFAVGLVLLTRQVGLLGLFMFSLVQSSLRLTPVAWDPDLWWAANSWVGPAAIGAMLVWSFVRSARVARAGSPSS